MFFFWWKLFLVGVAVQTEHDYVYMKSRVCASRWTPQNFESLTCLHCTAHANCSRSTFNNEKIKEQIEQ
eukprot:1991504-Amphidinium_carterae.1